MDEYIEPNVTTHAAYGSLLEEDVNCSNHLPFVAAWHMRLRQLSGEHVPHNLIHCRRCTVLLILITDPTRTDAVLIFAQLAGMGQLHQLLYSSILVTMVCLMATCSSTKGRRRVCRIVWHDLPLLVVCSLLSPITSHLAIPLAFLSSSVLFFLFIFYSFFCQ